MRLKRRGGRAGKVRNETAGREGKGGKREREGEEEEEEEEEG